MPSRNKTIALALARTIAILAVLLLSVAAVANAGQLASEQPSAHPLASCYAGIPAVKCNPQLYSPPAGEQGSPQPMPTPAADNGPKVVMCGAAFFDGSTVQLLEGRFGDLQCFRFEGSDRWIVFGDGMSQTSDAATPGGSIVAVMTCATADNNCLDPQATHTFGDFTVAYAPNPSSGRADLQTAFAGRFLWISASYCGLFTFDIDTLHWYGHDEATLTALLSQTDVPTPVAAPQTLGGAAALAASAPPASIACQ